MTVEERRGHRMTVGIAWLAGAPPVIALCIMALAGREIPVAAWIARGAVPIGLSWLLVQGRRWVRTIAVIGFSLNAAGALTQLIFANWTLTTMIALCTVGVTHGIAAVVLVASPDVRAFFRFQNRLLNLDLRGA